MNTEKRKNKISSPDQLLLEKSVPFALVFLLLKLIGHITKIFVYLELEFNCSSYP